jgi:hypothetical protein
MGQWCNPRRGKASRLGPSAGNSVAAGRLAQLKDFQFSERRFASAIWAAL